MSIFTFIKRYRDFNKLMAELKNLEVSANIQRLKQDRVAANSKSTLSSYERKKAEYAKGKAEAYENVVKLFINFMKKGEILKIKEKE